MIRPFTFVTMMLAAGSGLYLYQAKQQARVLDRQIHDIRADTDASRQRAEVLRAEYTLLNDPTRLAELAAAHLPDLKPTQPAQWTSLADLDKRLPPVGEPAAAPSPLEPGAPDAAPAAPSAPMAAAEPARPAPAAPQAPPPSPPRAPALAHAAPRPSVTAAREPMAPPAARPVARVMATAPAPLPVPTRAASRPSPPAAPPTAVASARPAPQPEAAAGTATPFVASALGMARTMLAPVAVTSASAAAYSAQGTAR
jgi:hypothetical protein